MADYIHNRLFFTGDTKAVRENFKSNEILYDIEWINDHVLYFQSRWRRPPEVVSGLSRLAGKYPVIYIGAKELGTEFFGEVWINGKCAGQTAVVDALCPETMEFTSKLSSRPIEKQVEALQEDQHDEMCGFREELKEMLSGEWEDYDGRLDPNSPYTLCKRPC